MSNSQTRSFLTRVNVAAFALLCAALSFCASILSAEEYDLNPGDTLTLGSELNNPANTVNVLGGTLKVDGTTDITANFNYDETSVLTIDLSNNSISSKHVTPMSQSLLSSDSRDIYFTNSGNTSAYLHLGTSYEYDRMDYSAYTGTYVAKDGAIVHIEYADHNIDVNLRMESGTTLVIPYKSGIYAYRTSNKSIELENATLQYGSYGNLFANGISFSGDCTLQCTGSKDSDWFRITSSNPDDGNSFSGSGTLTFIGPGYLAINNSYAATKYTGDFIIGTSAATGKLSLEGNNAINAGSSIKVVNGTIDWYDKSQAFKSLEFTKGSMAGMAGTLTISDEFLFNSSDNLTVGNVIAGAGKVTKKGVGTLTLSQSNSYTGGTSITEGTLSAGNVGAVGTGPLTVDNATFSVVSGTVSASSVTFTGDCTFDSSSGWNLLKSISGSGTLTLTGSGYLAVKSGYTATNYTGDIIVGTAAKAGKLSFEGGNVMNANTVVKVVNGTVDWRENAESFKSFEYYSGTMQNMTGTLTLSSEFLYDSSTNLTVSCVLAGTAKLTKKGSGTLTLSAENTYTGATSIKGGTLVATTLKAVGPGPLTIDNGTLSIVQDIVPASSVTITGDSTFNSSSGWNLVKGLTGSGTLTLTGTGYLAFKDGYSATGYTGDFLIGTTEKKGEISFESNNTINAGSSLKVVNGTVDWRGHTETFKSFEYYGGAGMKNPAGAVMILSDEFIYDSSTPLTVGVVIDGAASLTKNGDGTLSLSAANTYTGGTTISSGTLALTGSTGSLGSGDVTVGENATLEINYDNASTTATLPTLSMAEGSSLKVTSGKVEFSDDDVTLNNLSGENGDVNVTGALTLNNDKKTKYSGAISAQSITKTGDETLQLYCAAENMIDASSFVVSSGRLDMQKYFTGDLQINSGAAFSPGNSVGTLEQTGNFTLDSGAILLMELGGTDVDENDQLIVNGNLNLTNGSVIELVLSDNSSLKGGDTFTAILHANNSGDLADDFIDNYVRSYYFTGLEYSPMGDGTYAITGYLDPNAIPEPSTWALLLLGAAGLLYWRKRK
ncbi:MAG: autotransporter-associated beta strand repeat-containing protein [Thermoguttaceae bacterium]|nr:autotransporter-associated beta strand repeat-containing protein [Thermoguttaceae bacterium]